MSFLCDVDSSLHDNIHSIDYTVSSVTFTFRLTSSDGTNYYKYCCCTVVVTVTYMAALMLTSDTLVSLCGMV